MRYCPRLSVTARRALSIRVGLAASTTTAGRGVPDPALTEPAIAPWAKANDGVLAVKTRMVSVFTI